MKAQQAEKVLAVWTERNLTQAVRAGGIRPAYELDDVMSQAMEVLGSGRSLVLTGEAGVGKSAAIGELLRRVEEGTGPSSLSGKTVLQMSFHHRAASLKESNNIRPEFQSLSEVLRERQDIVPYFRDIHAAGYFGMGHNLEVLAMALKGLVLAEGEPFGVASLFEDWPELEKSFTVIHMDEPGLEKTLRILDFWSTDQEGITGKTYTMEAVEEALHLTHRFLARARQPRKSIDLLVNVASLTPAGGTISVDSVVERFSVTHKVPKALVDPLLPLDLEDVERRFASRILGQREAVDAVVRMIGRIKSGLTDIRRPFGVFLFAGPTGVGKTHVAQLLAEYLFGSQDRMLRLNMADFQTESSPDVLFGDPNDSRPQQKRGVLTQRILGQPFAVLLLDEFEKAHEKVHDRFLQLFDEGRFINGASETISCRSMILIATTNAGAEAFQSKPLGFWPASDVESLVHEVERRLSAVFRIEFLNRFDQVVVFRPLGREQVRTIAQRELEGLRARSGLKRREIHLEVDEAVVDWLAVNGYDPLFGARFLKRMLEREVTGAVADAIVRTNLEPRGRVSLSIRRNRVHAEVERPVSSSAQPKPRVTLPLGTTTKTRSIESLEAFREEAARLLAAARPLMQDLDAKSAEASDLLARMNYEGFWAGRGGAQELLVRYRELDVAIQVETRWAESVRALEKIAFQRETGGDLVRSVRVLESAAEALSAWKTRVETEGPGSVWVVLEAKERPGAKDRFFEDLAGMELAWCQKAGLSACVIGYEEADHVLVRACLDVEGPGASALLEMEAGVHRLSRGSGPDSRVRIDVIPQGHERAAGHQKIEPRKARKGLLGIEVRAWGRLEIEETGLVAEFLGSDAGTLTRFLADLNSSWKTRQAESPVVARLYGFEGTGGRDPRTNVVVPRLKDVLRGELDPFLAGWRLREREDKE